MIDSRLVAAISLVMMTVVLIHPIATSLTTVYWTRYSIDSLKIGKLIVILMMMMIMVVMMLQMMRMMMVMIIIMIMMMIIIMILMMKRRIIFTPIIDSTYDEILPLNDCLSTHGGGGSTTKQMLIDPVNPPVIMPVELLQVASILPVSYCMVDCLLHQYERPITNEDVKK